ncbi:MAG: type II secretion system inner membrane protein GspF [Syntrophales bacterium]|jgi:general secretion pathway protein F|nr:type II secretion system inner membrane protein GspF [Syntrophales bacterium]
MAVYEYRALSASGKTLKGIIDAESLFAARKKLRERDAYPVEIRETSARQETSHQTKRTVGSYFRKVSQSEVTTMTRQLATLLGAGLPLMSSLNALVAQTSNQHLKKILAQIKEDVNEGNSLAQSLSHYHRIFPPFYVNMIRAGEASGALDVVLERLADFNEKQRALRGRIRAALTYPLFMFFIGGIVLFVLMGFIVPKITAIFDEMHQTLPAITVFLITASGIIKSSWLALLILMIVMSIVLRYIFTRTHKGRYIWDRIKLAAPLMGSLIHKLAVARFSRTLGTLLGSGVPLLNSLSIVRNVVNNRLISDAIGEAAKDVEEGGSLSATLSRSDLFPPLVVQMIAVGEQSGALEAMLAKIADGYETEAESNILQLMSLLEPVMILVMGFFVGFVVISILLPIFEMNQLVR